MTDDQILEVVQAHKEGKKIQELLPHYDARNWYDVTFPTWDFAHNQYRVAPEPRKPRDLWLVMTSNGDWMEYPCRQSICDAQQIHVREVIE